MKIYYAIDNAIKKIEYVLVGAGLLAMSLLIFVNVMLRFFANTSLMWAEELTRYILIWLTCLGSNLCFRAGTHVNMDLLHIKTPKKVAKVLLCLTYIISIIACVILAKAGIKLVNNVMATGQFISSMPWLKTWVIDLAVPVFAILSIKDLTYLFIMNLIHRGEIIKSIGGEIE